MTNPENERLIDEAAVWLARLRGPDRTQDVEAGFHLWVKESAEHREAYERITSAWELTGAFRRRPLPNLSGWERAGFRAGFLKASAIVSAAASLALLAVYMVNREVGIATQTGEQRALLLPDGSRIYLNTETRVITRFDQRERRLELRGGEALFEVATDPLRPFRVDVGVRKVTALGTSFVVRHDANRTAVILIDGKVAVSDLEHSSKGETGGILLEPGQRLVMTDDSAPRLDHPSIEKETAWRLGRVELTDAPLSEAVAEMNRYSQAKLVIESVPFPPVRINGVFRTGDTRGFAAAVSKSYRFKVREDGGKIFLGR